MILGNLFDVCVIQRFFDVICRLFTNRSVIANMEKVQTGNGRGVISAPNNKHKDDAGSKSMPPMSSKADKFKIPCSNTDG